MNAPTWRGRKMLVPPLPVPQHVALDGARRAYVRGWCHAFLLALAVLVVAVGAREFLP